MVFQLKVGRQKNSTKLPTHPLDHGEPRAKYEYRNRFIASLVVMSPKTWFICAIAKPLVHNVCKHPFAMVQVANGLQYA